MSAVHTLTIPDDLLAWASQPEVSVHFARPWAEEVTKILAEADDGVPLKGSAVERLLSRLEALCAEAIRHSRQELLLGFDLFTAEWLGLKYTFDIPGEPPLVFGRGAKWDYQELHAVVESGVPASEVAHMTECKDLMASVFPGARIDAIFDPQKDSSGACDGCRTTDAIVMMTMEHGSQFCGTCWSAIVAENDEDVTTASEDAPKRQLSLRRTRER